MAYLSDDELLDTEGGFTGWDDETGAGATEETMEDKILRLIRNDGLANQPECGIMELPQMSRPSERSA